MFNGIQYIFSFNSFIAEFDCKLPGFDMTIPVSLEDNSPQQKNDDSFIRVAFINMLLEIVYKCRDPSVILDGLEVLSQDALPENGYKEWLYEQTLICMSEGIFSLVQLCKAANILATFYSDKKDNYELADKLWSGILDKSDEINAESISAVFSTLPNLKCSRDIVLKLVESKVDKFWQEYKIRDVLAILKAFTDVNLRSERVMQVLSQWLKVNIHTLNEDETLAVIYCFHKLEYVDKAIIKTIEKYIKARGLRIEEKDLVATICEYCLDFRIRSPIILEGASEYFIEHGNSLTTPQLFSIARVFGELNFSPPNGFRFWEKIEHTVEMKFAEFPPKEILSLLMSFIYLERYPLNFVRKIFNPYFMDRLHHQQSNSDMMASRTMLKIFDASLNMECKHYKGPFLPREQKDRPVNFDYRLLRMSNHLVQLMGDIVEDVNRVNTFVILSSVPRIPFYVVDLMIYPTKAARMFK